ncbi:MAG: hypothetical protein JJE04_08765 [Acidobacteriia bacterium]|nr:hypothetical protein [Terriglobia bacterium]
MIADIEKVLRMQGLDTRAEDLRKEIAALPVQIAAIEKLLEAHQRKLEADRAVLAASQKERRQLDLDVQTHQQKISKLRDQMLSAKTNEQYRAFQHEIEFCDKSIAKSEDRTLELMLASESLDNNVKAAEEALTTEKAEVERQKTEARQRTAIDLEQLKKLLAERAELAATVANPLLAQYEKLMRKRAGVAVSDATKGRCSACQLELRPQMYQELRKGESVMYCENCQRILHYNPPVDFDAASGAPAAVDPREGRRVDMS